LLLAHVKLAPCIKNNSFELSTTPVHLAIPGFSESTIFYPITMSSAAVAAAAPKFTGPSKIDKALFHVAVTRLGNHLDASPEGVAEESDYKKWGQTALKYLVHCCIFFFADILILLCV